MENKFVMACIMETIQLFQFHEKSHGHSGAYSVIQSDDDIFEVQPWMVNPFNPPHKIFWLICPSHQVSSYVI